MHASVRRLVAVLACAATVAASPEIRADTSEGCAPRCRIGFTCVAGACVAACNPPCAPSQSCVQTDAGLDCISSAAPASEPTHGPPTASSRALAIGLGIVVVSDGPSIPALTVSHHHRFGERVGWAIGGDFAFHFDDDTEIFGVIDPSLVVFFTPPGVFDAGMQIGPEVLFVAGGRTEFALFGATPGLFLRGGNDAVRFSIGLDVPLYFGGATSRRSENVFSVSLRPSAKIEGTLTPGLGLFLAGDLQIRLSGDSGVVYGGVWTGLSF